MFGAMALTECVRPKWSARARWELLAEAVREFDPTVVVLVARKAPRAAEILDLDFGYRPLVIADIGIELSRAELLGARVAIIDDVVNVGSTLARARNLVIDAQAAETRVFALARRQGSAIDDDLSDLCLVEDRPLDAAELGVFAAETPALLQANTLPYDLDFPLISCTVQHQGDSLATLLGALAAKYGSKNVYDVGSQTGAEPGFVVSASCFQPRQSHTARCVCTSTKTPARVTSCRCACTVRCETGHRLPAGSVSFGDDSEPSQQAPTQRRASACSSTRWN